jgi:hypothetical protein
MQSMYMANQLALGSLILRGNVAAAFAQAACITSMWVPPSAMVSTILALQMLLNALRPSSVSSSVYGLAGPASVVGTAVGVWVASIYLF